ncbi:MAG: hypothetical protein ABI255_09230 [Microbacteriaceae bacterium]
MSRITTLPAHLTGAFSYREALTAGVSKGRLRADDLTHPYQGVRVRGPLDGTPLAQLAAYRARMDGNEFFSHSSAALLFGMPLPRRLESATPLHVSVLEPGKPPEASGIVGHQLSDVVVLVHNGFRVSSPVDTWCRLGSMLSIGDLVAVGDYIVTGPDPFHGMPALAPLSALRAGVDRFAGRRGVRRLRAACPLVRIGVLSRKETQVRLLITNAGLPEPVLNYRVPECEDVWTVVDLAYPAYRLGLEYEGDWHRTDLRKFRDDIGRRERLLDVGWEIIRITDDDLARPDALIARIRKRLRARGALASPALLWV